MNKLESNLLNSDCPRDYKNMHCWESLIDIKKKEKRSMCKVDYKGQKNILKLELKRMTRGHSKSKYLMGICNCEMCRRYL